MANIFNIKSMTLTYDGGLSGDIYIRKSSDGFNCVELPGTPYAWYRSRDLSLEDSSGVAAWVDASGNNRNASPNGNMDAPVFKLNQINTLPSLRFSGSHGLLSSNWSTQGQPNTIVAVVKTGGGNPMSVIAGIDDNPDNMIRAYPDRFMITTSAQLNGTTDPNDEWRWVVGVFNGSSSKLYVDGILEATGDVSGEGASAMTIGCAGGLFDAGYSGTFSEFLVGDIAEVIFFNTELSNTVITGELAKYINCWYRL